MSYGFDVLQMSGVAPPPIFRNMQPNGPHPGPLGADSSPRSTVNSTIQPPRKKFVDEGKLRKVSNALPKEKKKRKRKRKRRVENKDLHRSFFLFRVHT